MQTEMPEFSVLPRLTLDNLCCCFQGPNPEFSTLSIARLRNLAYSHTAHSGAFLHKFETSETGLQQTDAL
jgi:hypothetical protein